MGIPKSLVPLEYYPTAPRSGSEGARLFRMMNYIIYGDSPEVYAEIISPPLDLAENIATANLTGTVTCMVNNKVVVGAGTAFTSELHLGQMILVHSGLTSIPLIVDFITDDTHFTACRAPQASLAAAQATRLPRLFEVGKKRGTLLSGNAVELDLGSILCVGSGTLRLNGAVLPGVSLTASRRPQIAIYDSTTGNYNVCFLGMATPTTLTAADGPVGTKNMQGGVYSIRAVPARQATNGYNNPSPKAELTLTTGNKIRGTFSAADTANLQDAWIIYATLYTQGGGINGPWFRYEPNELIIYVEVGPGPGQIPAAGGTYDIEYNDAELGGNDLLSFDNDPPPDAEFIAALSGTGSPIIPIWVSTQGPGETSPGPFIVAAKADNIEAAPLGLAVSTSLPDTIIGFLVAQGRLYLLCSNTLQIGQATQTIDSRIPPVAVRPFWKSGFKNADSALFVDGFLIGATNHGLARSLADGDEGSEEFAFAVAVDELIRDLSPGHLRLQLDTKNNAIVLWHCGDSINASGFWTTRCWMYSLRSNKWIGDIVLTSTTGDMLVSGVANVNGELEFLAGGVQSDTSVVMRTYRWNAGSGTPVPGYLAWGFRDEGVENRAKEIGAIRVTAKLSGSPTAGIHTVQPGQQINITALETTNVGCASDPIAIPTIDAQGNPIVEVTQSDRIELNVSNAMQWTVRVESIWDGTTRKDRIDEVVVEVEVEGVRN